MLRIQDKEGRTKFILEDESDEPVSVDEMILQDTQNEKEKEKEENLDA